MAVAYYSQTSRKGPPKMSSPGGHLRGVVAHESLDDTGFNFASLAYGNCSDLCHAWSDLIMWKVNFEKSHGTSLWESSLVLLRNAIMPSGRFRGVKSKRKLQTFSSKSGRGLLWEVVAYKMFQI